MADSKGNGEDLNDSTCSSSPLECPQRVKKFSNGNVKACLILEFVNLVQLLFLRV